MLGTIELLVEQNKKRRLEVLKASGYIPTLEAWAKSACAPVFFRTASGNCSNGTMTFLDSGGTILGLTAGHVAREIVATCGGRPGYRCQVGATELQLSSLIAVHPTLDLACFRLSPELVAAARHNAVTVSVWPPQVIVERDLVLYGGYPGMYREEIEGRFDNAFVWFGALVDSASEHQGGTALRIGESMTAGEERVPANADLGGWSGGPVFRLTERESLTRLELAGIIYEYDNNTEIVLAHNLRSLRRDGTFDVSLT